MSIKKSELRDWLRKEPGDWDDAMLSMLKHPLPVAELNPNEVFRLASLFLKTNNYDACIDCCNKLVQEDGSYRKRDRNLLANALFRKSDFSKALNHYKILLDIDDQPRIRYHLSKCLFKTGNITDAEQCIFDNYHDDNTKPKWYYAHEVHVKEKLGKYNDALISIENALKYFPGDEMILTKKYHLQVLIGQTEDSMETLSIILVVNPDNDRMRYTKAQLHLQKQEFELAEKEFNQIIDKEPHVKAYIGLSELEMIKGNVNKAVDFTNRALEQADTAMDILCCVNMMVKLDLLDRVEEILEGLDETEFNSDHYILLSSIRNNQKKHDVAIELLEKAIALDKQNPNHLIELARIYFDKGDYRMAEFELIINDLLDSNLAFHARYLYCRIARKEQKKHITLQRFRDFSKLYPENFLVKKELISELTQLSRFNEVTALLNIELDTNPKNVEAFKLLIKNYLIQQNYSKVIELIDSFQLHHESMVDVDILSQKVKCLREMGKFDQCNDLISNLLEKDPESYSINMELAQLNRSMGYLYFFEKDFYNEKSFAIHTKMLEQYPLKVKQTRLELVQDLILLNKFNDAFTLTEKSIADYPDELNYYLQKIKILHKVGSQDQSFSFIEKALQVFPEDQQLWFMKCESLFNQGLISKAESELLQLYEFNPSHPDTIKLLIKLYIKINDFENADKFLSKGIKLASGIVLNDSIIVDYFLLQKDSRIQLENVLKISEEPEDDRLLKIDVPQSMFNELIHLGDVIIPSQLVLKFEEKSKEPVIEYSLDNECWYRASSAIHEEEGLKFSYKLRDIPIKYLRIDSHNILKELTIYTYFPISTTSNLKSDILSDWSGASFSFKIVDTGLGDQMHYLRTSALIAESLGMTFAGYQADDLDIIRERVTENPYLYYDLGFRNSIVNMDDFEVIQIDLKANHHLAHGMLKWPSYKIFINELHGQITEAYNQKIVIEGKPIKNPLFVFYVADHTFSRTVARQFYPFIEPNTFYRELMAKDFKSQKLERGENLKNEGQIKVVLQCRLGDVANVPVSNNQKDYIVIPFSGEVFDRENFEINHQRNSNLKIINKIGKELKEQFGDHIDICFMTDGYDYGIDYLLKYKKNLLSELNLSEDYLNRLKIELEKELKETFRFVDTLLYGESYDNLISSIDNIDEADVILSSNGQFSNETKMSFLTRGKRVFIVKKLYANLRVKLSGNSEDLFWDTEIKPKKIVKKASKFIRSLLIPDTSK